MRSVLQMSATGMILSLCIFFAVCTRGSSTGIRLRPPLRPLGRAAASPALVPLLNQPWLELRQRREDVEYQLAKRRRKRI